MHIKFCGAALGVTGSCHLLMGGGHKILLDCGQFQGGKQQEAQNFDEFPFDPKEIECVLLSHAHIDHCGRLPLLVKRGFKGKIYCTDATADLLPVMLKDSAYIHEKEAEWQNRKNERAGRSPIEPLYTIKDSEEALKLTFPVLYDQLFKINDEMEAVFNEAGHILGSAITEIWVKEKTGENGQNEKQGNGKEKISKIVFSGDLGVMDRPILRNPKIIKKADYLIMEATYGNRLHPKNSASIDELLDIVIKTTDRGGTVVIPSFAVGRTQELIFEFNRFYEENQQYKEKLDKLNVYIDSPMATTATEVFKKNAQVFDEETKEYILKGDNPLDFKNLKFTRTSDDSKALNMNREPKIIISASGMCEAGRIRHHLKHNLWDPKSSVVFVGYQAEGTLGRNLLNGLKDVTLFGEEIHVNAEIYDLEGFSAHADKEGLLEWISGFIKEPKQIFLVHGETDAKVDLAAAIKEKLGYDTVTVSGISEFELEHGELLSKEEALADALDEETMETIRKRIADVHEHIEKSLYNTSLSAGSEISPKKMVDINNIVLQLEKSSMSLGSALTDRDEQN